MVIAYFLYNCSILGEVGPWHDGKFPLPNWSVAVTFGLPLLDGCRIICACRLMDARMGVQLTLEELSIFFFFKL